MSNMHNLSKMSNMRISVDISPDWMPALRIAVAKSGERSVAAFLRAYIQQVINGEQITQVEQHTQPTQVDAVDEVTQVEQSAPITLDRAGDAGKVTNVAREVEEVAKPKRVGTATPKNPDLQVPPNYSRKPQSARPIPPYIGRKTEEK